MHTKHKEDRFLPPHRREDDEMAMNTQAAGNMTGGPVYSGGGHHHGETDSYGSQQPVAQGGMYNPPQGGYVAPSRNF